MDQTAQGMRSLTPRRLLVAAVAAFTTIAMVRADEIVIPDSTAAAGLEAFVDESSKPSDAADDVAATASTHTEPAMAQNTDAVPVAVETIATFKVHRSPIREDNLTIVALTETNDEVKISLPDLEAISFNKICRTAEGARLACGRLARTALWNFIVHQDIACRMGAARTGVAQKVVSCSVGGRELAEFVVRAGIARPLASSEWEAAMTEARESRRGMWADAETRERLIHTASHEPHGKAVTVAAAR